MNEKVLKTLEFNKITAALSSFAYSKAAKARCASLTPSCDLCQIQKSQAETTAAVSRIRKKRAPAFSPLSDITASLRLLEIGSSLNTRELLDISGNLDTALAVKKFLEPERSDEAADALAFYYGELEPCEGLSLEIKRCIISPDEISDEASSALKDIRRRKTAAAGKISRTLNNLITSQSMKAYLQDSLVTIRQGRYCIPVKAEHKNHIPGMIHDESSSGATVFIEPMSVVKLNNEIRELELKEEDEIRRILEHLSSMCAGYFRAIEEGFRLLTELDFIFAKAKYSERLKAAEPEFLENGFIELKRARHPLIDKKSAVPIDVTLGKDYSMLIVTGPNTGGKTVSLKTVGLLCLMGQSGLHIPAESGSSLCVFNEICADIGDEQSIEQSLSTFSSHMTNIVRILKEADKKSLVLLDELCSGTDPAEGAALAEAILSSFFERGCRLMATTHYSELKLFALQTKGVQNASCEFDIETLRPTYRLITGLPGKSNAFAISKKLGLTDEIIENARGKLTGDTLSFEDVLAKIEADKKAAEKEKAGAAITLKEAQELKARIEKEQRILDEKKESVLDQAKQEAYEILSEAKDFADNAIREIRKSSKDIPLAPLERTRTDIGNKAKQARISVKEKAAKSPEAGKPLTAKNVVVGMNVKCASMNMNGVITSLPDSKNKVNVQMGIFNKKIDISDLFALSEEEAFAQDAKSSPSKKSGSINYSKSMGISNEIKLLGLTVDDALIELDKYLDDAQIAHLSPVRIVHGKGTGALRNAVTQMLKKDKRIKSFKQAEYGEGDAGVTIAELK